MAEQLSPVENKVGKPVEHISAEEERAIAALDKKRMKTHIQRHGHKGILTIDPESKMESVTTLRADYVAPKGPGVRLRGIRSELLEKHIAQMISEKIQAERSPPPPKTDYCSTTRRDFSVEGFVSRTPETTQVHDYKADQAITFWSENCKKIQGVTPIQTVNTPFRKSALFSTPISERLDEIEPPPDN